MKIAHSGSSLEFWHKILIFVLALFILDLFLAFSLQLRLTDLLFVEGALVFGAGAIIASGVANLRRETWQTLYASPDGHREFLEEQRKKQVFDGVLLMIIGAVLIGLSVLASVTI